MSDIGALPRSWEVVSLWIRIGQLTQSVFSRKNSKPQINADERRYIIVPDFTGFPIIGAINVTESCKTTLRKERKVRKAARHAPLWLNLFSTLVHERVQQPGFHLRLMGVGG